MDPLYKPPALNPERSETYGELLRRWRTCPKYARVAVTSLLEDYGRVDREAMLDGAQAFEVAAALLERLAKE